MANEVEQDLPSDNSSEKAKDKDRYQIQIDRVHYTVEQEALTGAELRALVVPPVGPDRDLFEVVPGGTDRKVEASDVVRMRNGLRFFTAPSHINPGARL